MTTVGLRLYFVVLVPAAVLMALEIVSSRLLAPHFGNSVYVWGSIIGIFLAAMSVGYSWGGWLADRRPRLADLGVLLLAASLAQLVVLTLGRPAVAYFGELTGGAPGGTLLVVTLLFGPPTVCLATVSPYAVRLASHDLALVGGTAGRLYALSTFGSLAGTLGATFVLIPRLGLDAILRLLLAATVVSAVVALSSETRRRWPALGLAGLLLAVLLLPLGLAERPSYLVERRMTPYQTLEVHDTGAVVSLYSDGALHSAVRKDTGATVLRYVDHAPTALLFQPEVADVLVLGMGSGSVGRSLRRGDDGLSVEYVEIDPAVVEIAREHLRFDDPPGAVHVDDARRFLARHPERRWDYVYADTYIGYSIPFHLATREFFELVRQRLEPGGVFGLNLPAHPGDPLSRSLRRTLREVFRHVLVFETGGNHLVLACDECAPPEPEALVERGRRLDRRWSFDPPLARLAAHWTATPPELGDAALLTDRYAPVNHLLSFDREPRRLETIEDAN